MNKMKAEFFVGEQLQPVAASYQFEFNNNASKPKDYNSANLEIVKGADKPIYWGPTNTFPEDAIEEVKRSTVIAPTLAKLARLIYGGGIILGKRGVKDNKETFELDFSSDEAKKIWKALRKMKADFYIMGAALDFVWFNDFRPEIALSRDRRSIAAVYHQPVRQVRWKMPNQKNELTHAYIQADWREATESDYKNMTKLDVVTSDYYEHERINELAKNDKDKFLYRQIIPNQFANAFYHTPTWWTAKLSKWLDYSIKIPEFKDFILENQMNIKYVIYVDQDYWKAVYPKWDRLSNKEKSSIKEKELNEFLKSMKGSKNAANAVFLPTLRSPNGEMLKSWEVVDFSKSIGKEGKGLFIDDSSEASSQILQAIGMDPTITGNGPGKNFGAGSGSDKRVAGNMEIMTLRWAQDIILQPFNLMRDFNGWDEDYVFRIRNTIQSTLDQGSSEIKSNGTIN